MTGLGPLGRHRVWLVCLALAIVVPALSPISWPAWPASPPPHASVVMTTTASSIVLPADVTTVSAPPPTSSALQIDERLAWVIAAVFALAVIVGLTRLVASLFAVRALLAGAASVELSPETTVELEAFMKARRRAMPPIRCSGRVASPAVAGVFWATILVPRDFTDRPDAEVRAALLHELAHVVRRDYAVNLAGELLALPLCWHPALHLILAEVRRSRELVCDAMASAAMRSQRAYAQSLVSLAGAIDPAQGHGASAAVGLFGKPLLEERLMHLIGPKRSTGPALKALGLVGGVAVAAGVLGAASLLHVSTALAQPASAPQATPATAATPATLYAPAAPAAPAAPESPTAPEAPSAIAAQAAEAPAAAEAATDSDDEDQVVVDQGHHGGHKHKWVSSSGKTYTVINDEDGDLTPAQQAKLEKDIAKAMEKAAKAEAMVESPEFKARIAEATAKAEKAQAFVNSPEFQAKIAEATAKAAQAEAMVNSPEFKAKIDRAERMEKSPEWRKAKEDLRRAADHLRALEEQEHDQ